MNVSQSQQFSETAGIVLCGGKSSRMGRPKWSLPIGEETCLQRTIRIVREVVSPIVVVAAEDQPVTGLPDDVILTRDRIPEKGPLAGISAGLECLQNQDSIGSAYVTSCDAPLLKPGFIAAVIERLGNHELAVVKEDRFHHPLAAVYRLSLLDRVNELLAADRLRPLFLIEESDSREIDVEELRDIDPHLGSLHNMNTPEEYAKVLETLGWPVPAWVHEDE
jgi:molybdopterin-guanine dinucleotide biosynthesis protein A